MQLKDDFPKPQIVYSIDDFDNDITVPFIPKLREKPHAKMPIDENVKFAQNDKTKFMKSINDVQLNFWEPTLLKRNSRIMSFPIHISLSLRILSTCQNNCRQTLRRSLRQSLKRINIHSLTQRKDWKFRIILIKTFDFSFQEPDRWPFPPKGNRYRCRAQPRAQFPGFDLSYPDVDPWKRLYCGSFPNLAAVDRAEFSLFFDHWIFN